MNADCNPLANAEWLAVSHFDVDVASGRHAGTVPACMHMGKISDFLQMSKC